MKVQVKYLAQARYAAGMAAESVEVADVCSLETLVRRLAEIHSDPLRKHLLAADGSLAHGILLFVNDRQETNPGAVALHDGDVVTLMAPMAGG